MEEYKSAAFLDRDGVLNVDSGYVHTKKSFFWIPGAIEAVQELKDAGLLVVVVTNQSGIARGYFTEKQLCDLHSWMNEELVAAGAGIDAFYHCPYHGEGSIDQYRFENHPNRKPNPGMILTAAREWSLDLSRSFLIGDEVRDTEAARRAGIDGYLFDDDNLADFVREILKARGLTQDK